MILNDMYIDSQIEGRNIDCIDCQKGFFLNNAEEESLRSRFGNDFTPPKRCKSCRIKKKARFESREREEGFVGDQYSPPEM